MLQLTKRALPAEVQRVKGQVVCLGFLRHTLDENGHVAVLRPVSLFFRQTGTTLQAAHEFLHGDISLLKRRMYVLFPGILLTLPALPAAVHNLNLRPVLHLNDHDAAFRHEHDKIRFVVHIVAAVHVIFLATVEDYPVCRERCHGIIHHALATLHFLHGNS